MFGYASPVRWRRLLGFSGLHPTQARYSPARPSTAYNALPPCPSTTEVTDVNAAGKAKRKKPRSPSSQPSAEMMTAAGLFTAGEGTVQTDHPRFEASG